MVDRVGIAALRGPTGYLRRRKATSVFVDAEAKTTAARLSRRTRAWHIAAFICWDAAVAKVVIADCEI